MKIFAFLLAIVFLSGCQTTHRFAQPGAGWQTWSGQLKYSNPQRSIIGDVVVSTRGTGEFQLEFLAGPGFPLLSLKQDGGHMTAKGALSFGPPGHLIAWEKLRPAFISLAPQAPKLTVDAPRSGEHFDFRFGH